MWRVHGLIGALSVTTLAVVSCSGMRGTAGEQHPPIVLGAKQIVRQSTSQYSPPALFVDSSGLVAVAWIEKEPRNEHGVVQLSRAAEPGQAVGQPVTVNRPEAAPDATHSAPGFAAGPAGEMYLTWSIPTPAPDGVSSSDLMLTRSLDGGRSFEPSVVVNDDGATASHGFEGLTVARDGTVYLSWLDGRDKAKDKSGAGTYFARSTDQGRTIGRNVKVDGMSCPCCRVATLAAPDGTVLTSWRKMFDGGIRDIVVARSDDGGQGFAPPSLVRKDGWVFPACPHRGPSLGADRNRRLYVTWYTEGADEQARVYFATSDDGGRTFSEPRSLHTSTTSLPDQPKMAVHPDGVVLVVWEEVTGVRNRVVMRVSTDRGATFSAPQTINDGVKKASPTVAIGESGAFAVAWNGRAFPNDQIVVQTGMITLLSGTNGR